MKRIDLLRCLADEGCVLVRTRGGHDAFHPSSSMAGEASRSASSSAASNE